MQQLFVPMDVSLDPEAHELLRVWHTKGGISITIDTNAYDSRGVEEGEIWGIMLAQIAHGIGAKVAQKIGTPTNLEVGEVRKAFLTELEKLMEAEEETK